MTISLAAGRRLLEEELQRFEDSEVAPLALWSAQALFRQAEPIHRAALLKAVLQGIHQSCGVNARRLRYRLATHVVRSTPPAPWGASLLGLRDRLVEGAARETHPPAVAELHQLAAALAGGAVAACVAGEYGALGAASRKELGDDWLVRLLADPLLQLAARPGSSRTVTGNACTLVHGTLEGLAPWASARAVLTAAVGCLRAMLVLCVSKKEVLACPPAYRALQSSVALLGERVKPAAVQALGAVCQGGLRQREWQARRAALATLALLVSSIGRGQRARQALAELSRALGPALERLGKEDRVEHVRREALALAQSLAAGSASGEEPEGDCQHDPEQLEPAESGPAAPAPIVAVAAAAAPPAEHPVEQLERWAEQAAPSGCALQLPMRPPGGAALPPEFSLRLRLELPAVEVRLQSTGQDGPGAPGGSQGVYAWAAGAAAPGAGCSQTGAKPSAAPAQHSIPATVAIDSTLAAPARTMAMAASEEQQQPKQQQHPPWVGSYGEALSPLASLATSPLPSFDPPRLVPEWAVSPSPADVGGGSDPRQRMSPGGSAGSSSSDGAGSQPSPPAEAASSAARGSLTTMVNRAVSRLAMLQELQETVLAEPLRAAAAAAAPGASRLAGPGGFGSPHAGPALSAIPESAERSSASSLPAQPLGRPRAEGGADATPSSFRPGQHSGSGPGWAAVPSVQGGSSDDDDEGEYPAGREGVGRWRGLENPLWDTSRPPSAAASPRAPDSTPEPPGAGGASAPPPRRQAAAGIASAAAAHAVRQSLHLDVGQLEGAVQLAEPSPMLQQSHGPGLAQRGASGPWGNLGLLSMRSVGSQQGFGQLLAREAEQEVSAYLRGSIQAAAPAEQQPGPQQQGDAHPPTAPSSQPGSGAGDWTIASQAGGGVASDLASPAANVFDPDQVIARMALLKAWLSPLHAASEPPARNRSPPLAPGLPVSRREAEALAAAAGRMPGNWGEAAGAEDLQQALADVAAREAEALAAHYSALLGAQLRQSQGADPKRAPQAVQEAHSALRAAASLAAKQDLDHFLTQRLPQLAEVLASRDQLLEVLQRLDESEVTA